MAYDMYQEIILQHYRSPKHFGDLPGAELYGEEHNPLCGDRIEMRLKLAGDRRTVEEARFTGDGCAISVASASMLTTRLQGRPVDEVRAITRDDVLKMVGIPLSPVRIKCALTGFAALGRALNPTTEGGAPSAEPAEGASGA